MGPCVDGQGGRGEQHGTYRACGHKLLPITHAGPCAPSGWRQRVAVPAKRGRALQRHTVACPQRCLSSVTPLFPPFTLQWVPSESFFPPNGTTDMFYDAGPFNLTQLDAFCTAQLGGGGPLPDTRTLPLLFGGAADDFAAASNILFSNGDLDPWSSGGWWWRWCVCVGGGGGGGGG